MSYLKRRISLLLCVLMVFSTVFVVTPENVQAASASYSISSSIGTSSDSTVCVYKGISKCYIGDYMTAIEYKDDPYGNSLGLLSRQKKVSYKSSNTSVVSVDKKGLIKAKKKGSATITVKYKGATVKVKLKVMDKKAFDKKIAGLSYDVPDPKTTEKKAQDFLKITGETPQMSDKNRYKLLNAYNNYSQTSGVASIASFDFTTGGLAYEFCIHSPSAVRANEAWGIISGYCSTSNPFSTSNGECFRIKSIKGKGKTIDVKLKSAVTDDQIFGAQTQFIWDSKVKEVSKYTFPIVVRDTSDGYEYYAIATIKKGSDKMTIKLKNLKLSKNKKYELVAKTSTGRNGRYLGDWLDGSLNKKSKFTFKAN